MSTQTFTQMTRADQVGHVAAGLASASSVSANVVNIGSLVLAHEGLELQTISGTVTLTSTGDGTVNVKDAAGADLNLGAGKYILAASVDGTVTASDFTFKLAAAGSSDPIIAASSTVPAHAGSVLNVLGSSSDASASGLASVDGVIQLTVVKGTKGDQLVVTLTVIDISSD